MLPERVIRHRHVEPDSWQVLGLEGEIPATLPADPVIVPLAAWIQRRDELRARKQPVGVWLEAGDDPQQLAHDLPSLALVAVHFPKFADGRGYSTAVLLRTRLGFRGELRAIGDVGRDQLFYLTRVGFDSFKLPPLRGRDAAAA